jgi:Icc-related predicted phosphoesterase
LTIPDGDVLIHAGDFSMRAKHHDLIEFAKWFKSLPHQHKIFVPGNHDMVCESDSHWSRQEFSGVIYLDHSVTGRIPGLRVFGSPYSQAIYDPSPWFFDYQAGARSQELWRQIPDGIDVLITHGPPKGILDLVDEAHPGEDPHVGDVNLLHRVHEVKPKVHIFGHIHEGYGSYIREHLDTRFYNVCVCDVNYQPNNPITVIDL